ncbi:MAG: CcoQ/FixQ family Cbb3-type cytochrome c oxidase assembly chaperone [Bdellovibrionaceae bacterium]|nr:CcoQ/FixQ family Cbb3-type cytochrome c oxidase assembly chaperone [Pseudobdellovibrionaceae bacterium]|tara:strand:- start:363 stop:536 length:174 start_codon:yes stop_codon:yes gene_type:complete
MKQIGLAHFTDIHLTIIALFIFVLFFIGTTFYVYSKNRRGFYEKMSRLPLSQGDDNE